MKKDNRNFDNVGKSSDPISMSNIPQGSVTKSKNV